MGDPIKYLIPEIVNTDNAFRSTKVIKHLNYGIAYYKSMSILDHPDKLSTKDGGEGVFMTLILYAKLEDYHWISEYSRT